jgi:hypothetical protein
VREEVIIGIKNLERNIALETVLFPVSMKIICFEESSGEKEFC